MELDYSIVIPAKNEQENLPQLLKSLKLSQPNTEIIIVNDGSTDDTKEIALSYGCTVINHPYSLGNGAAVKSGARACKTEYIVFMDADGQHSPDKIPELLNQLKNGHSMSVGARNPNTHASSLRRFANFIYNKIASFITNFNVQDLTSGFRAVKKDTFNRFLYLLPNGFSYPTTITMAFLRSGFPVAYIPIDAKKRGGKSHINPLTDGARFLIIIIKVGSLYSPLKFFSPPSVVLFMLGTINYIYTYATNGTFTNMSALLILSSIVLFMFGLLAEQITVLTYAASQRREKK